MTHGHTILIVDDEPHVVRSLQALLQREYRVLGATGAAEALEIMKREPVHVVLSDQRMPEKSGIQLLQEVAQQWPDVVGLLVTGYADISAVIDAINRGNVYRYVTKPWNPDELLTIVRGACTHHVLIEERVHLLEQLQQKNRELSEANELKTAFLTVAGHEFRTPVAILLGLSKLLLGDAAIPQKTRNFLERINTVSGRLDKLLGQIMAMLSAGQFNQFLSREGEDIARLIEQSIEDVTPFVELRRQMLQLDVADDIGSMLLDGEKIRACLNNLLLNAVRFTQDEGKIDVRVDRTVDGLTIEVRDTGCGISTQNLPRMFEPFFTQFDVSHHSSGHHEFGTRGLGLGLSIVKRFVEMHGGRVSVRSKLGQGSSFSIFLPDLPEDALHPGIRVA